MMKRLRIAESGNSQILKVPLVKRYYITLHYITVFSARPTTNANALASIVSLQAQF